MATSNRDFSFDYRFSQQLEALSGLSESLTLKLLDLEERFEELEARKSSFENQAEKILLDSKDRLKHLHSLLELLPNKDELISVHQEKDEGSHPEGLDGSPPCEIFSRQGNAMPAEELVEDLLEVVSGKEEKSFEET